MPKVATFNSTYIPKDVLFRDDSGKQIRNDQFPPNERVSVHLTYADVEQKARYVQYYSEGDTDEGMKVFNRTAYNEALSRHILKIDNLGVAGGQLITNGAELVACKSPELNDFKLDLFNRICGVRYDEDDEETGALFPGESRPSS